MATKVEAVGLDNPLSTAGLTTSEDAAALASSASEGDAAATVPATSWVDMEKALEGLQDRSKSEQEVVAVMEELVQAKVDVAVNALEARLASSDRNLESTVRSVFGHLTEAPTNWQ